MQKDRKLGPIHCEKGSPEAKRIEDTHGFDAAFEKQNKRKAGTSDGSDHQADSTAGVGKKKASKKKATRKGDKS